MDGIEAARGVSEELGLELHGGGERTIERKKRMMKNEILGESRKGKGDKETTFGLKI